MNEVMNHPELFFLENFNIDRIFTTIEKTDYLFLYYIRGCCAKEDSEGRCYLSDLSKAMNIEIPALSRQIEKLQGKGYISWHTDHSAGKTYVELTSKAIELMSDERKRMVSAYEKLLAEIGPEEIERTLQTMRKITDILKEPDTTLTA